MPNIVAVELDLLSESQSGKAETANNLFDALSSAALFGVKSLSGLSLELYGGNMILAGVPTAIATQTLTLSDDTTNYIYSTAAGVFTKVTSALTGWPGPITSPADAIALYRLVTADGFVTDDFDVYVPSLGLPGSTGPQGDPGPEQADLSEQRVRWWAAAGGGSTASNAFGFNATTSLVTGTARSLGTSTFRDTIPYVSYITSASASSQGQLYTSTQWCFRGNAAGRGGFTFSMRFCMESANSPANFRSFFGLYTTTIGNVEPDTLFDIVGVGSKTGEANLSVIHNDGSGTATMVGLGSNFPARATNNVYELTLTCEPFGSSIDYSLLDCETGNEVTGTISTNLPSNTVFLGWIAWCSNGGTASIASFGMMQVVGVSTW